MADQDLHPMRHSLAHIMATAVTTLWPEAKLGVGPVVENGFYYDIDLGDKTISEEDFPRIEAEMRKVIEQDQPFVKTDKPVDEAIAWAKEAKQPYKEELLNDLKRSGTTSAKDIDSAELGLASDGSKVDTVGFYQNGNFIDLCRGPHVESTGKVGAFRLMRVAGAYWRGKEDNPQMQRLYGVAFETKAELDEHITMLEEAKARDHRKLGKELDLFTVSQRVGAGLPLFTPRGTVLRDTLTSYAEQIRKQAGYSRVTVPHIAKTELYKVSGHWDKFGDELFLVKSQETSDEFALKPMNCPHHNEIYASSQRSYRDLPLRYFETTTVYRDEKTGELGGLSRVRSITQDDSHVYARLDQLETEVTSQVNQLKELYATLDMPLRARLSFRDDGDGYLGDKKLWDEAQQAIRDLAAKNELDSFEAEGEAAFYGPKIDFMAKDAIGREHQVATIQVDFVQPERFKLTYVDDEGNEQQPIMIHCALLGSIERFLSVYIEHTAGWFPFWIAPEQVRILPITDVIADYVKKIEDILNNVVLSKPVKYNELRFTTDARNESLGRKIRDGAAMKIPLLIIVGNRDKEQETVSIRLKEEEKQIKLTELANFLTTL